MRLQLRAQRGELRPRRDGLGLRGPCRPVRRVGEAGDEQVEEAADHHPLPHPRGEIDARAPAHKRLDRERREQPERRRRRHGGEMEEDEAPADPPRPRDPTHEPEDPDRDDAADHEVHQHRLELAGHPGGAGAALLRNRQQGARRPRDRREAGDGGKVHALKIRAAHQPVPPFDPLDLPFGESGLSRRSPGADVVSPSVPQPPVTCPDPHDSPGRAASPST